MNGTDGQGKMHLAPPTARRLLSALHSATRLLGVPGGYRHPEQSLCARHVVHLGSASPLRAAMTGTARLDIVIETLVLDNYAQIIGCCEL